MTVLDAPLPIRLLAHLYGLVVGGLLLIAFGLYRATVRIVWENEANLASAPGIVAFWHESLPLYFLAFPRLPGGQVWMQHPVLTMSPIHFLLRRLGVDILAFGSSGHGGSRALDDVVAPHEAGRSTVINPDGPSGPVHRARGGAIRMNQRTGVPIVPLTFDCSRSFRLPTWDAKRVPWPFSRVTIRVGERLEAPDEERLTRALSER
jgi:lysophospholipid acyltransferase (LPLAT)-like uncharacterized protein